MKLLIDDRKSDCRENDPREREMEERCLMELDGFEQRSTSVPPTSLHSSLNSMISSLFLHLLGMASLLTTRPLAACSILSSARTGNR